MKNEMKDPEGSHIPRTLLQTPLLSDEEHFQEKFPR